MDTRLSEFLSPNSNGLHLLNGGSGGQVHVECILQRLLSVVPD